MINFCTFKPIIKFCGASRKKKDVHSKKGTVGSTGNIIPTIPSPKQIKPNIMYIIFLIFIKRLMLAMTN